MAINKKQDFYLNDGKLDLSILNEEITKEPVQEYNTILEDIELIQTDDEDISTTLEKMAMMFEDDEFNKAFSEERLEEEKKEFGQID